MFQITYKTISFAQVAIPVPVNVTPVCLKSFKQRNLRVGFHAVTATNLKNFSNHKLLDVVPTIWLDMLMSSPIFAPEGHMLLRVYQYLNILCKLYPIPLRLGTQHRPVLSL